MEELRGGGGMVHAEWEGVEVMRAGGGGRR
jgi:hypothetical protein